jgi:hypothetical protein
MTPVYRRGLQTQWFEPFSSLSRQRNHIPSVPIPSKTHRPTGDHVSLLVPRDDYVMTTGLEWRCRAHRSGTANVPSIKGSRSLRHSGGL